MSVRCSEEEEDKEETGREKEEEGKERKKKEMGNKARQGNMKKMSVRRHWEKMHM